MHVLICECIATQRQAIAVVVKFKFKFIPDDSDFVTVWLLWSGTL
jgi:hypothetical protein